MRFVDNVAENSLFKFPSTYQNILLGENTCISQKYQYFILLDPQSELTTYIDIKDIDWACEKAIKAFTSNDNKLCLVGIGREDLNNDLVSLNEYITTSIRKEGKDFGLCQLKKEYALDIVRYKQHFTYVPNR